MRDRSRDKSQRGTTLQGSDKGEYNSYEIG